MLWKQHKTQLLRVIFVLTERFKFLDSLNLNFLSGINKFNSCIGVFILFSLFLNAITGENPVVLLFLNHLYPNISASTHIELHHSLILYKIAIESIISQRAIKANELCPKVVYGIC